MQELLGGSPNRRQFQGADGELYWAGLYGRSRMFPGGVRTWSEISFRTRIGREVGVVMVEPSLRLAALSEEELRELLRKAGPAAW